MTGEVTPLVPNWDDVLRDVEPAGDAQAVKEQLSMEWVLEQYGVLLGAQGRTACISPAHESADPNFALWVTEDGTQAGYCFACGYHADVFKVIMHFENTQFSRARARAAKLLVKFRKATKDGWAPTLRQQERTEPDTEHFARVLVAAQAHAQKDPYVIQALVDEKQRDNPGWARVTAQGLMQDWGVGSSDTEVRRRVPVSNPDASPHSHQLRVVQYQRVVIPYFLRLPDGTLQVRAIKERTRLRTGNGLVWGEWLPFFKPIWRPGPDTGILYGSWRISRGGGQSGSPTV